MPSLPPKRDEESCLGKTYQLMVTGKTEPSNRIQALAVSPSQNAAVECLVPPDVKSDPPAT